MYADGLLLVLRKSRLVCHVTGQWMGGFLYADDLSLIAPSCAILARMLEMVAEKGTFLLVKILGTVCLPASTLWGRFE